MNRKILYFILGVCCTGLGGCGFFAGPASRPVTRNYDLAQPAVIPTPGFDVVVLPFTSEAAARYKMVTRSGVELYQDEYHRWSQTPSMLLTRYLRMALAEDCTKHRKGMPVYELSGVVLAFEADLKTKMAFLCIRYTIRNQNTGAVLRDGLLRYNVPLDANKPVPEAFALSMTTAVQKVVSELVDMMKGFSAKK